MYLYSFSYLYTHKWGPNLREAAKITPIPRSGRQNFNCKFKGTHTVQLPCMHYTLSLLQTKLAEKTCFSKIDFF